MYPLHPLTVHFPIALLLANALFTLCYFRFHQPSFETSAYYCLIAGWFGALVAILSGAIEAVRQVFGPAAPHADALQWVNAHAIVGIALLVIYGQALLRRRRNVGLLDDAQQRIGYLRLLAIGTVLVVADGWLGGHLVYSLGVGVR